jgi:predicted ATPase
MELVSGYSGVGKSSVVNERHKLLVPPRGFFASGKFDRYKRDIMAGKLDRLPDATQQTLRQLACLGNCSDASILKIVLKDSKETRSALWEAVRAGLIFEGHDASEGRPHVKRNLATPSDEESSGPKYRTSVLPSRLSLIR